MNSTTYEQTAFRHQAETSTGSRGTGGIGNAILEWLGRVGERSAMGRRAEAFARLNSLTDEQLAAVGLRREELLARCFGGQVLL